jgi:RNA-binding protein 25
MAPPPNTTAYVGKISPLVDDDLMRAVLEACGELRRCEPGRQTLRAPRGAWLSDAPPRCSWKRSTDPETGAQKRFGFADFASPDGVLRALRVLRERPLAGSELLLNVSQATQKFLDFHVAQLKSRGRATIVAAPQLSNPPAEGAAPEPGSVAAEAAAEAAEEAAADKAAVNAIQVRRRRCAHHCTLLCTHRLLSCSGAGASEARLSAGD